MATGTKLVGQSVARREDEKLLRGRGAFVEDIKVPGIQWASLVRSPHAHARIRSIDTSAALQTPGVTAVLTGKDIHPRFGTNPTVSLKFYDAESAPYDLIAVDKARHVGEVVAVVVADTRYGARDAADLIFVDYEPLEAAIEVERALRDDAPRVHDDRPNGIIHWRYQLGNVSQAFEEAAVIVRERIVNQKIHGVPMEPRAGLAHWDPVQETMSLWATVQTPHALRDHLAEILHLTADSVRVVAPDVGGGFGVKHEDPEYALICIASMQLGVPVKWVATRTEDFLAMHQARGKTSYLEVSADADGKVTALRVRHLHDLGAYAKGPEPSLSASSAMISTGVYDIPNVEFDVENAYTNTTPQGPYRGAGRPEGIHLIERGLDRLASELGLDPTEIRRRNYLPPFDQPMRSGGGDMFDSGNYEASLDQVLELSDYQHLREQQQQARADGRHMGIGVASWVKTGGSGPSPVDPSSSRYEWGRVRVDRGGKVTLFTGSSPHGQGGETVFAQIVADVFGISDGDVTVLHGDTAAVAHGVGTYGSRALVTGGMSAKIAAEKVCDKMLRLAAHMMGCQSDEMTLEGGVFICTTDRERQLPFTEVAEASFQVLARPEDMEFGLDEDSFFQPSGLTYNFGTYVAVVEVDTETGDVDLQRLYTVDDQGVIVNPMTVVGQVHGGATQGIGQALYEISEYDQAGQLLNASLMDYAIPTAEMTPEFVVAFSETPSPLNSLGVKGMGEGPTTGAPSAVVNAVVDALSPLGVSHIEMPLTPERVWRAIQDAQG